MRLPTGDISGKVFDNCQGAFGPPILQCVGDLCARATWKDAIAIDRRDPNEITDIGYNPLSAGFDEEIVVELGKIFFHYLGLLPNHSEKCLERAALFGVADAINSRYELV